MIVSSAPIRSTVPRTPRAAALRARLDLPLRPNARRAPRAAEPLALPPPATMEGFGPGSSLSFGLHGHQFQAFVSFGAHASRRTRALAIRDRRIPAHDRARAPEPRPHRRPRPLRPGPADPRVRQLGDPRSPRKSSSSAASTATSAPGCRDARAAERPFGLRADVWVDPGPEPGRARGRHAPEWHTASTSTATSGARWRRIGSPGSPQYSGPRRFSEPETRIARALIERDPAAGDDLVPPASGRPVRAWGGSIRRRAPLRPARTPSLPRARVAGRDRAELAEPPLPGDGLVRRRATPRSARTPAAAARYARAIKATAAR